MTGKVLKAVVPGHPGLDQNLAGSPPAARAPCHLHHLLEQGLCGPEINTEQPLIDIDYPNKGYTGKIMSFGQQLRSQHDIDLTTPDLVEQRLQFALASRAIPIDTRDPRVGKSLDQFCLESFGTLPNMYQVFSPAIRTFLGYRTLVTTVVTT
jgi:hypothetical protein